MLGSEEVLREAEVDYVANVRDRDGGLGDVGGENDLALPAHRTFEDFAMVIFGKSDGGMQDDDLEFQWVLQVIDDVKESARWNVSIKRPK